MFEAVKPDDEGSARFEASEAGIFPAGHVVLLQRSLDDLERQRAIKVTGEGEREGKRLCSLEGEIPVTARRLWRKMVPKGGCCKMLQVFFWYMLDLLNLVERLHFNLWLYYPKTPSYKPMCNVSMSMHQSRCCDFGGVALWYLGQATG